MRYHLVKVIQIAFTYIGTIVGAGFATGQEILQFFTRFGNAAIPAILISTVLFVILGSKIMLLAHDIKARSFEDLNTYLFGPTFGRWISFVLLIILFCTTSIMLAGGGALFKEFFGLPYQIGLIMTLILAYFIVMRGVDGILTVNTIVVPLVLFFTAIVVWVALRSPTANFWYSLTNEHGAIFSSMSPFLYIGFNLALAQAVLVPIGSAIPDKRTVYWGGVAGGIGIGIMLLAGHIALSAKMPGITQFEIPMGIVVQSLGQAIQLIFLLLIYSEIFTTLIANVYGLSLQLENKTSFPRPVIVATILVLSFGVSQFGFSTLLSTLYPVFGFLSLIWIWRLFRFSSVKTI